MENTKKLKRIKSDMARKASVPTIPTKTGVVLACGQGDVGQLGLGEGVIECSRPRVVNLKNVVDICAGGVHSICLTLSGEVYSFGCNDEGALGRETDESGSEFLPGKVNLPGFCVKISAGDSHSACLLSDGRVFAWGSFRDSHGSMGLTLDGNKQLPIEIFPGKVCCDISSGVDHLVILTCDRQIYTMGCAEQGQLGRVSLRSASGESRRGNTELLKLGLVNIIRSRYVDTIWASTYCTFAKIFEKEDIYAFGLNNYHQLGIQRETDTRVSTPTLTKLVNVKSIAGGQHHTIILSKDGKCYALGRPEYGRLGLGDLSKVAVKPELITSLEEKKIVDISCGEVQSFAITDSGEVYAWGMGSNLQLGTGKENDEHTPILICSKQMQGKVALKVSSGGQHTLFLMTDMEKKENKPLVESIIDAVQDKISQAPAKKRRVDEYGDANPVDIHKIELMNRTSIGVGASIIEKPITKKIARKRKIK